VSGQFLGIRGFSDYHLIRVIRSNHNLCHQ